MSATRLLFVRTSMGTKLVVSVESSEPGKGGHSSLSIPFARAHSDPDG